MASSRDIQLEELELGSLSSVKTTFADGRGGDGGTWDILVVRFEGEYRPGSAGNLDANYMTAMAEAGIVAWDPDGLVLDLRKLRYSWGDRLDMVFFAGKDRRADDPFPHAVVVGPACAEAVRTLCLGVDSSAPLSTVGWVFDEFDAAWDHVVAELDQTAGAVQQGDGD